MKFLSKIYLIVFVAFISFSISSNAQSKIAYVDSDLLVSNMPEYKKAIADIDAFEKALQNNIKNEESKLQNYYDSIVKQISAGELTPSQQKTEEKKIQQMQKDLDKYVSTAEADFVKKKQDLTDPVYDIFNKALDKVSADNGYSYIFNKDRILHFKNGIDATAKVNAALGN